MKEDYLWDKTGADKGVEKLENALKAFRYKETMPPALPRKEIEPAAAPPLPARPFFRWRFAWPAALAAAAACALIVTVVWFELSAGGNHKQIATAPSETVAPPPDRAPTRDETFIQTRRANAPLERTETPPPTRVKRQMVVKVRQIIAPTRRKTAPARNLEARAETPALTAEERYAYRQLMLALSITGSTLKTVRDKVQGGGDNQSAVFETGRK